MNIKEAENMKIKIQIDKTILREMKKDIDELLNEDFEEEIAVTEENIQKATGLRKKAMRITNKYWDLRAVDIKIVSSAGTELTRLI